MRLRALALAFTLFASSAVADDLAGLWRVEGKSPDGKPYSGFATLSPMGHEWELASSLGWSGRGKLAGKTLTLARRDSSGGAVEALNPGNGSAPAQSVVYGLSADGRSLAGASERLSRVKTPTGRFEPERVVLRRGQTLEVKVAMDPSEALDAAYIGDARPSTVVVSRGGDRISLTGRAPGKTTLLLRLGTYGAVLARLEVEVQAGLCQQVLARVKEVAARNEKPIVIFDLDDTLFDTRSRTLAILRTYQGQPRLQSLALEQIKHGLPETLINAGYSPEEVEGELGQKIRRHWQRGFFSDESLRLDTVIPGGLEYVKALVAAGAHVYYVTGRKESAGKLSREVLETAGFPIEPVATVVLKPNPVAGVAKEETPAFKGRVTRETITKQGTIVAAFDNEPGNCNEFRLNIPAEARSVFLKTLWPEESPDLIGGIDTIPDFLE